MSSSSSPRLAAAALALAAAGTATVAQARDNVYFSIGANVAPGVSVGVSNARPITRRCTCNRRRSTWSRRRSTCQPAPIYVSPAPVYYGAAPVYYERGYRHGQRQHWRSEHRRHDHGRGHGTAATDPSFSRLGPARERRGPFFRSAWPRSAGEGGSRRGGW